MLFRNINFEAINLLQKASLLQKAEVALIWLVFLGVLFEVVWDAIGYHVNTHIYDVSGNIPFITKAFLILLMSDASGIQLLDCSKLVVNWKNGNDVINF